MSLPDQSYTRNLLLGLMQPADFALLQPHLRRIDLWQGYCMVSSNEPIEHIHFMEGGVASIVTDMAGDEIEVGVFGREGMSGTAILLGSDTTPDRTFVQIDHATALRMPAIALLEAIAESESLRMMLLRFAHVLGLQTSRTAASNARLEVGQRLARWLLMCHDRVEGDVLHLTHEFVAMMLVVRRSGVTVALQELERLGAISAVRGAITILDRASLEEMAGDTYGRAEAEYRRLIGPFGPDRRQAAPPPAVIAPA